MKLGSHLGHKQYRDGKIRDGTSQYYSVGCNHNNRCNYCRNNRLFKHKRNRPIEEYDHNIKRHEEETEGDSWPSKKSK